MLFAILMFNKYSDTFEDKIFYEQVYLSIGYKNV